MTHKKELEEDMLHIFTNIDGHNKEETENPKEPLETLHVYPVEGGILILREAEIIDSSPAPDEQSEEPTTPKQSPDKTYQKYAFALFLLLLCFFISFDMLDFSLLSHTTPTATITIVPKEQDMSITTTILAVPENIKPGQIQSRILPTLSLLQAKTAKATGKGHQDATYATGTITFYNGLLTSQTIAAGTTLTGSNGVQVSINQDAIIPAAKPPIEGHIIVSAHALKTGSQGNIRAQDINEPCCATSVLAVNTAAFQGGQSARDFTYVTNNDFQNLAASMKETITQNLQTAMLSQLLAGEALVTPICTSTSNADHTIGEESTAVTVTVFASCTALTYNRQDLEAATAKIYASSAAKKGKEGYKLLGTMQIYVLQSQITDQKRGIATLTVTLTGTWGYEITPKNHILPLLAGKSQQQALKIILALPGVEAVYITGIGKNGTLPSDPNHIHILLLYSAAKILKYTA